MNVMKRTIGKFNNQSYVTYTFSGGYEYRIYDNGIEFGYTPKGNYTKIVTTRKLCRIASEYEDRRIQIQG
jgi:hypothetical protein